MHSDPGQVHVTLLKEDALGRVEKLTRGAASCVRRVACGGRLPLSRALARRLLARERRALVALAGLESVPELEPPGVWQDQAGRAGRAADARDTLLRGFLEGLPLHRARELPEDFFERLDELLGQLHGRGVCHNDLHKEQNVIVLPDGRPGLIDFQLASVHARRGRVFASRVRDDLRHVDKHRRRYTRAGRGPRGAPSDPGPRPRRSLLAAVWLRTAKPLYNLVTRRLLDARDAEERRPSAGPWPTWTPPVGPARRPGD